MWASLLRSGCDIGFINTAFQDPPGGHARSSLIRSSLSFCSTSSSSRSTLYWRASLRCRTTLARSAASPSRGRAARSPAAAAAAWSSSSPAVAGG